MKNSVPVCLSILSFQHDAGPMLIYGPEGQRRRRVMERRVGPRS